MSSKPIKHGRGWRLRWFDEHDVRRSQTVKTDYKTAGLILKKNETEAEERRRGLRPSVTPKLFGELCDHYLKYYSASKRNFRTERSNIENHLRPHFGKLKLHEIREQHLSSYKTEKNHLSAKTVHNQLTLLGTMLRVACDNKWLSNLPKIRKPKIITLDQNFRYLRSDEEIAHFLLAAKEEPEKLPYHLYATAIFTGLRAGELAGLKRDDIDFDRNLIKVQRSFDGPTKNGETRYVPILKILRPLLMEWLLSHNFEFVFPNQCGKMHDRAARIFQEIFHRVLSRANFPWTSSGGKPKRYIVFHDLRHTFASQWMMKGGDLFKLQKILGHKSVQMTLRYAHLSPNAFEGDLERFGNIAPGFGDGAELIQMPHVQNS